MSTSTMEKERDQIQQIAADLFKEFQVQILSMESSGTDSWVGVSLIKAVDPTLDNQGLALRFRALLLLAKSLNWDTSPSRRDALLKNPRGTLDFFYSLVIRKKTDKPKLKIRKE